MEQASPHPLTRFRQASNLSRAELARLAGTSRQTIHRIEAGKQTPSLALVGRLVKLAKDECRDLSANDFLSDAGEAR